MGGLPGRSDCGEIRKDPQSFAALYDEWCTFLNLSRREVILQRLRNILERALESVLFMEISPKKLSRYEMVVPLDHVLKG